MANTSNEWFTGDETINCTRVLTVEGNQYTYIIHWIGVYCPTRYEYRNDKV